MLEAGDLEALSSESLRYNDCDARTLLYLQTIMTTIGSAMPAGRVLSTVSRYHWQVAYLPTSFRKNDTNFLAPRYRNHG